MRTVKCEKDLGELKGAAKEVLTAYWHNIMDKILFDDEAGIVYDPEDEGYMVLLESKSECYEENEEVLIRKSHSYIYQDGCWEGVEFVMGYYVIVYITGNSFGLTYFVHEDICSPKLKIALQQALEVLEWFTTEETK